MFVRRSLIWLLAAFHFGLLTVFANGEHFSIAPSLRFNGQGETQLVVQVAIPSGFKLYADWFQVEVPKQVKIIPLSLPVPQSAKDVVSGEHKLVYDQSFSAVYLVENFTNDILSVEIGYQGCDQTTCFLPAKKEFQLKVGNIPEVLENDKNDLGLPSEDAIIAAPVARHGVARLPHAVRHYNKSIPSVSAPLRLAENGRADWLAHIRSNYKVAAIHSGYMDTRGFISFLYFSGKDGAELSSIQKTWQVGKLWISMLLMILGGLALNLTPCVLPLIPVNLAIIGAGVRAVSIWRGFLLGTLYGLGIVLAYGGLGLITVLTGAQFGSINASPWFNLGVALLFLALGLALLDVIVIDLSRFQGRFLQMEGRGLVFVIILGAVSALLAGACVAPVVIAVLLLAADLYMKGQIIGLLMPFLLGVGMALPWPFAGAGLSFLPKPGKWMIHIKYIFAVVILLAAFYYFYLGSKLFYARYSIPTDSRISHSEFSRNARLQRLWRSHCGQADDIWLAFPEGLAAANKEKKPRAALAGFGQARGKPILIYFWASWCKSCQAMNATTFNDSLVRKKMDEFVCVKYQAENPRDNSTKSVLREFGVMGLPTFVILKPNEVR